VVILLGDILLGYLSRNLEGKYYGFDIYQGVFGGFGRGFYFFGDL
jgi:hypothetical protein